MQPEAVIRARTGDVDAFASLTADHAGRLLAVARLILRDEECAADAVTLEWIPINGYRTLPSGVEETGQLDTAAMADTSPRMTRPVARTGAADDAACR